jgi:hypothetical protein
MLRAGNPFLRVDKESVIGTLKAAGSLDPDVLHARKTSFHTTVRFPKQAGAICILAGALVSLAAKVVVIGVPVALAGIWCWRRGARNHATVEAAFAEFVSSAGT